MTRRKATVEHCVLGNNSFRCLHCGVETALDMPVSIRVMVAMTKDFTDQHARCKPSPQGAQRFQYKTPEEWATSWDTGTSSMTIWKVMMGKPLAQGTATPQDPADFGRCYRLLEAFPQWRARMGEMLRVAGWASLVTAWPTLEALYEKELPTGHAPKLYEEMKRLREFAKCGSQGLDEGHCKRCGLDPGDGSEECPPGFLT